MTRDELRFTLRYKDKNGPKTLLEVRSRKSLPEIDAKKLKSELAKKYHCCVKVENPKIRNGGMLNVLLFGTYDGEELQKYLKSYIRGEPIV